jgi:3-oxoacyl-[acyl-carrier protein] reductase
MDLGLREKVALVTGASKGLGKAIAEEFAKEGAHVSICARGKADLEKTAAELRVHGVKVVATSGDAARNDDVQRVIDDTIKHLGRIDILVNNAGEAWIGRNVESSDQDWRDCMEVNLYSAVRFTRGIVPQMRRQGGGRIINMSTVSGHTPPPMLVDLQPRCSRTLKRCRSSWLRTISWSTAYARHWCIRRSGNAWLMLWSA